MDSESRIFIQPNGERQVGARLVQAACKLEARALRYRASKLNDESLAVELLESAVHAVAQRNAESAVRNPEAYLLRTFQHLVNQELDLRSIFQPVELHELDRRSSRQWASSEDIERWITIRQILDRMPKDLREIVNARLMGYTEEETAAMQGVTASAIANRVSHHMKPFLKRLFKGTR